MKLGGNHATTCLWISASRESNKTSFEQRRVCELPTSHIVVSEIQHIEGDISANRLLQLHHRSQDLKLTRFRGHRTVCVQGVHDGQDEIAVPAQFRRQMVELVHAGRTPEELAAEFEPTAQSIRNWVAQSARNAGRGDGSLTTAEREELHR